MSVIKVRDLSIGYEGQPIIENIDLDINEGEYLTVVGENGSGKSTLMKTLLGLIPPLKGSIEFSDGLTHKEIGYLPQQTEVQRDFPSSINEIVLSGCQNRGRFRAFYSREDKELARKNMERLGIYDIRNKSYRQLSGGQQQRVLLARALCATEKLLILDEPVSGLDPKVTKDMYELIKSLNDEGTTIIMISHDINAAVAYSSHILHIGNKVFYGTKDEYMNSRIGKAFLSEMEAQDDR